MFFRDGVQAYPSCVQLVSAMLWRHPENFELDKVKVCPLLCCGSKAMEVYWQGREHG
ncbi:inositol 3-alpha-galactosyltransferase [Populus alba x Populus x berolinensis]|nr:inositol 3-alpha-galactosyltransferase [Populus alba x Populus x berolinensis]